MDRIYKGFGKSITLSDALITIETSSITGKKTVAKIPIDSITTIMFTTGTMTRNGFITFLNGNGIGEKVELVSDATFNDHSVMFQLNQNKSFTELIELLKHDVSELKVSPYLLKRVSKIPINATVYNSAPTDSSQTCEPTPVEDKRPYISTPSKPAKSPVVDAPVFTLPVSKKQQIKQRIAQNKRDGIACCPKCASTSLSANKKGFGIGKAVVGAAVTGGIGLVAGNIGAKKVRITCLNCGHQWMAGK